MEAPGRGGVRPKTASGMAGVAARARPDVENAHFEDVAGLGVLDRDRAGQQMHADAFAGAALKRAFGRSRAAAGDRFMFFGPFEHAFGAGIARDHAFVIVIGVGGGVPLLSALDSGARVMTNRVMQGAVERAIARVREGASLARALGETRAFPPLLVHLVASGETSGKLEQMLGRAAHLETQALERRLAVFLTLLEPVMILVMGGVVLMIVLAILLPIIEINQLVH